jgi:hypothetical protein
MKPYASEAEAVAKVPFGGLAGSGLSAAGQGSIRLTASLPGQTIDSNRTPSVIPLFVRRTAVCDESSGLLEMASCSDLSLQPPKDGYKPRTP